MDAGHSDTVRAAPLHELPFHRGDSIDRFTVLDVLGMGGMGVVVSAYDATLDRKVAIKVLRPDRLALEPAEGRSRLLREAQAMARLSHPNVITVHEVGTVGEQVFVAMELVDGDTLSTWLAREKRPWRDVVRVFVQAGRGLAAAHKAGLVHRDFKPDNVLVGVDGEVRVTDFGLAGVSAGAPGPAATAMLAARLTQTGTVMGTPAFMSPEQHRGDESDARSDQFSFCVALHDALYGVRPFAGETGKELLDAMTARRLATPVKEAPRWLRPLVLRGLQPLREDRWPSMDALLDALSHDPQAVRRRRLLWGGGAIAAAAVAVMAGLLLTRERPALCQGAAAQARTVWDGATRERVRAAFLATRSALAGDLFDRADRLLAARVEGWAAAHTEACEATRVRGEQSEAMLDLRMSCLERARRQIEALTSLWQRDAVDPATAVQAAGSVGDVSACADTDALAMPVAPPRDPAAEGRIDQVRAQLDAIEAHQRAGQYTEGLALAREAVAAARPLRYAPILAEALYRNGVLECRAGKVDIGEDLLQEAARSAAEAHDDLLSARVAIKLVAELGTDGKRLAEATALSTFAEAVVARAGNRDELVVELLAAQSGLLFSQGEHDESLARLRRALQLAEQRRGPDDETVNRLTSNMALNLARLGRMDEALPLLQRVLASEERALGPEHPAVAGTLDSLSTVLKVRGELEEANRQAERALAITRKAFPPGHPKIAQRLSLLAGLRLRHGRRDEARALWEEAEKIQVASLGPDHPDTAATRGDLAGLAIENGDTETARRLLESVIAAKTRAQGENHPSVAHAWYTLGLAFLRDEDWKRAEDGFGRALAILRKQPGDVPEMAEALSGMGQVRSGQGRHAEAIALLEEAKAADERVRGAKSPYRRLFLVPLGEAYLRAGRTGRAVETLERAVALAEQERKGTVELQRVRFILAGALWANGARGRATALAAEARDRLVELEEPDLRAVVEKWLRAHGGRGKARSRTRH